MTLAATRQREPGLTLRRATLTVGRALLIDLPTGINPAEILIRIQGQDVVERR
jgi:hypothetical protein